MNQSINDVLVINELELLYIDKVITLKELTKALNLLKEKSDILLTYLSIIKNKRIEGR